MYFDIDTLANVSPHAVLTVVVFMVVVVRVAVNVPASLLVGVTVLQVAGSEWRELRQTSLY